MAARRFTLDEARAAMPELLGLADELVVTRAELVASGSRPDLPLAERKALEAGFSDLLDRIVGLGVELKGWAPLLVDFPAELAGREVLLCWLEGERELAWFHDPAHGFAGRRPLGDLSG